MNVSRTISSAALAVVVASGMVCILGFGPLDPPAGPVTPTPGPEPRTPISLLTTPGDADSLFRITQPGSYYLTGNVTGVAGKHGIEIEASGVTVDLNGFDLSGIPGMGFFSGVSVTGTGLTNIAVVNGSVRGWGGQAGIDLLNVFGATNCRVERITASGNAGAGINVGSASGTGTTIINCSANLNTGNGISALSGATITGCTAVGNLANGINVGSGCLVADCASRGNTQDGIRCANDCIIRDNVCTANGSGAGSGASVHVTGSRNRIEANHCTGADRGVDVDAAQNFIVRNTCSMHTTNWDIVANNFYGPIVNRAGQATSSYTGDGTAASTLNSTDPFSNFTY